MTSMLHRSDSDNAVRPPAPTGGTGVSCQLARGHDQPRRELHRGRRSTHERAHDTLRRHFAVRPAWPHRGPRGLHPSDSVRRGPRDHPAAHLGSDAHPNDAGPPVRPDDRQRLRAQARRSRGAATPASARCTASATPSNAAGRGRSRSKSTAIPRWRTPTPPAPPACRARSSAATAAPISQRSTRTSSSSRARSPARSWPRCPRIAPTSRSSTRRRPTAPATSLLEGIIGVQKEAVLAAQKAIVTVEEIVDRFEGLGPNAVILPSWTVHAIVAVPGRRASVVRARLLCARQCVLCRVGRDLARSRHFQRWIQEHVMEGASRTSRTARTRGVAPRHA